VCCPREELWGDADRTGKPIDRSRLLKRYKQALKRAGVRDVRFHDLRHTFGTHMAAQGVPMRTLQERMGHRDLKTTLIYADYAPSPADRPGQRRVPGHQFGHQFERNWQ
jgi:integrase